MIGLIDGVLIMSHVRDSENYVGISVFDIIRVTIHVGLTVYVNDLE
jgi:hypothetical protein